MAAVKEYVKCNTIMGRVRLRRQKEILIALLFFPILGIFARRHHDAANANASRNQTLDAEAVTCGPTH
jgi:hypothetical protein